VRKFNVLVTRDVTESAYVEVEADSEEKAQEQAVAQANAGTLAEPWKVDDDTLGKTECYVTCCEELDDE